MTPQGIVTKPSTKASKSVLAERLPLLREAQDVVATGDERGSEALGLEAGPVVVSAAISDPVSVAGSFGEARQAEFVAGEASVPEWLPKTVARDIAPDVEDDWLASQPKREQSLARLMLAQDGLRAALAELPVVELRASCDERRSSVFPTSSAVEINSDDARAAQATVRRLKGELNVIFVRNALQFLTETRQFLGLCFSKLTLGGLLIVSAPHQFLYERKLRLPSRRNPLHRRFYTANTLLADVEEAIDPGEFRVRYLGESDADFPYWAGSEREPGGRAGHPSGDRKDRASAVAA